VVGAQELERVEPLRRRSKVTPRDKCAQAAVEIAEAVRGTVNDTTALREVLDRLVDG